MEFLDTGENRSGILASMRRALVLFLMVSTFTPGFDAPTSLGVDGNRIFRQSAIADIACGPSSLFNWMSHGGGGLQGVMSDFK